MNKNLKTFIFIFSLLTIIDFAFSQNFWEAATKPPYNVSAITVANNGDIWACGWYDNNMYLSTDNGNTWTSRYNGFLQNYAEVIAINPINGYIFVSSYDSDIEYGLLRSTDNGENWTGVTDKMRINDILVTTSGEIYLGVGRSVNNYHFERGVYYSSDNGNTWINKSNGLLSSDKSVYSLAMGTDGTLYVATSHSGVYRSTNGGDEWLPSLDNTDAITWDLTVSKDGSIFVAAWDKGFLKSTDKGLTWNQINNGLNFREARRIIYNPITEHIFIHEPSYGIYMSTDLGAEWHARSDGIPSGTNVNTFAFNPNTGMMFAGIGYESGLYRSSDINQEVTITPNTLDFGNVAIGESSIKYFQIKNSGIEHLVISSVANSGINSNEFTRYSSPDSTNSQIIVNAGETVTLAAKFTPTSMGQKSSSFIFLHNAYSSPSILRLEGYGVSASIETDFWERTSGPNDYILSVAVASNGDVWVGGLGGVYLSTDDGDTWIPKDNNLPMHISPQYGVTPIAISPVNGYIFAAVELQGLFRSTNNGENWVNVKEGYIRSILITPSGEIYIGTVLDGLLFSTDNGNTWINKSNGLSNAVLSLALGTEGILYAGINVGIYYSTNGGDEWLCGLFGEGPVRGITVFDSLIFASTSHHILRSIDKGLTWHQFHGNSGYFSFHEIWTIINNPKTEHIFISCLYDGVYRSTNFGGSWREVNSGLPPIVENNPIEKKLAINPKTGMIFLGFGNDGVYRSTQDNIPIVSNGNIDVTPKFIDFGWLQPPYSYKDTVIYVTNTGTTDILISEISITGGQYFDAFFHNLYRPVTLKINETHKIIVTYIPYPLQNSLGILKIITDTDSEAIVVLTGNGIISVEEPEEIPTTYSLSQNYPNPFNPTTKIQYSLPEASNIKLSVYNSIGQEVMRLVNENQSAGKYIVDLNAQNLPSGVYFYRLQTSKFVDTKKMLLLK